MCSVTDADQVFCVLSQMCSVYCHRFLDVLCVLSQTRPARCGLCSVTDHKMCSVYFHKLRDVFYVLSQTARCELCTVTDYKTRAVTDYKM